MTMLKLDAIRIDGGTQSRASLNQAVVEEYSQTVRDGADFPPIVVFHDGKKYWLADGFHRVAAYRAAGGIEINADVRQGDKRDAILFSVGANSDHGLRRTNDDKRRAVMTLLSDKEWSAWSDRDIAKQCAVSHTFVAKLRPDDTGNVASMDRTFIHPKTGKPAVMGTANIGRKAEQAANDAAREQARAALPDHIRRGEEAKLRNGSNHAAVAGTKPVAADDDLEALNEALNAKCEEQADYIKAIEADLAESRRRVAMFDAMAVQFEKGGFEAVMATKDERIQGLLRQVETESADKVAWMRKADFWKKTAIDLGYVSPNSQIEMEPEQPAPVAADVEQAPF